MLINGLKAFFLTALMVTVSVAVVDLTFFANYYPLVILIVVLYAAIPNLIFLLVLYYTRIFRSVLTNTKLLVLEIILLIATSYTMNKIVESLPETVRFESRNDVFGIRPCFDEKFQLLYAFIILFGMLLLVKKITRAK